MTNEEADTALILENELKRRVEQVVRSVLHNVVRSELDKALKESKGALLMEISMSVGKMLQLIEKEGRKPLWEQIPTPPAIHEIKE